MCFSPEMDVAAAVVVGVVAVDTLRRVRNPTEIALAALPAVFAVHQLIEAFVWWGLQGKVSAALGDAATRGYLTIAWLLPVLVPIAVLAIEPPARRRLGAVFVVVGAGVTTALAWATVQGPITASIKGHHVSYRVDLHRADLVIALYVLATCGPMLLSAHRHVRIYGLVNLPVVGALAWLNQSGFVSLWCVWAAVTSVAINLHLRYDPADGQGARSASGTTPMPSGRR